MSEAFRKVGEAMGNLGLSAAVAAAAVETSSRHYAVASRSVIKKFKCAKCGKYKLGQEKVIGPRRKGDQGSCRGVSPAWLCRCSHGSSWADRKGMAAEHGRLCG